MCAHQASALSELVGRGVHGSLQIEGAVYELACQLASVTNKTTSKGFPQNVGTNKSNQSAAAVGGSSSVTRGRGRVKTVQTNRARTGAPPALSRWVYSPLYKENRWKERRRDWKIKT